MFLIYFCHNFKVKENPPRPKNKKKSSWLLCCVRGVKEGKGNRVNLLSRMKEYDGTEI